jgi:general secretion pathway protein N
MRRIPVPMAVLSLCAVVLAGTLAMELAASPEPDFAPLPVPAAAAPARLGAEIPTFTPEPAELSEVIVERPLFFASRRPPPPEPDGPAPEVQKASMVDFALVGTILSSSGRVALVKPSKDPLVELAEGQAVGGWTVDRIGADSVVFRSGAEVETVPVRDFSGKPKAAAAAQPPRKPASQAAPAPAAQQRRVIGRR